MSYNRKAPPEAKRKKKLVRLSGLTESLIAPALVKKSAYLSQLIANWPQIAGPMDHWAKPADIRPASAEGDDEGLLTLSIHSGRGPEALANSADILERVNRFVGFGLVGQLRVKQDLPFSADTHSAPQPPFPNSTEPKSASLKEALERLGATLEAKSRK